MTTHHDDVAVSEDHPNDDMNRRNQLADRWLAGGIYAVIVLVVVPMLLVKSMTLPLWLPLLMALGPFAVGIWHAVTPKQLSFKWMLLSLIVAAMMLIGAIFAIVFGSTNWASYSLLTFGGMWTYALLGLIPVIMYAWTLQRLLTQRAFVGTIITGAFSLLAPWFWAGFMLYAQYHAL